MKGYNSIRRGTSLDRFKTELKNKYLCNKPPSFYFSGINRTYNVLHARLRKTVITMLRNACNCVKV